MLNGHFLFHKRLGARKESGLVILINKTIVGKVEFFSMRERGPGIIIMLNKWYKVTILHSPARMLCHNDEEADCLYEDVWETMRKHTKIQFFHNL